jgi:hypothetical protein
MDTPPDDITATVTAIAQQLGETEKQPVAIIGRLVRQVGVDAALALLQETQQIEAQGGLLLPDGSRRRTPGGVYFHLAKERLPGWDRRAVFRRGRRRSGPPARPPAPPFAWADRLAPVQEAQPESGEATTVKITLIGRPGRVVERGDVVLTTLRSGNPPNLPKGLPAPPAEPTTYIVLIARKQWAKVAEAIQDPDDALIIEGYPALDPQLRGIAVFTQNVTTKKQQAAKRQSQAGAMLVQRNS